MRFAVFAAIAVLALALSPSAGVAQDAPGLPKGPVPYTKLHPKPKPKPHAPPATQAPSSQASVSPSVPALTPAAAKPSPANPAAAATPRPTESPPKEEAAQAERPPAPPPPPPVAPTAAAGPAARLATGQTIPAAELEAFVDGMVRGAMARDHIAGVTVSVVQNGQVLMKKGYGFASLEPRRSVDPDRTLFRIGSISKTFTWIALMKEVEAGRMRLNQPVNLYLPEKVQVKDQGYDQPVRVANLMDHSAGFEDRALGQLFERNYNRVRPIDVYLRQERPHRVRAPGVLSSYSNYGAALAGEAVAYTAGKPYERLIEDEILNPLGMTHTTFREPHPPKAGLPAPMPLALAADVSDAFRGSSAGFQRRDYEYIGQVAPAGAGSSTAGDMARYMLMQLGGGQSGGVTIYGPTTAAAFRTPLRSTPPGINGWAHGLSIRELPGGHVSYGHDGGTLSFFSYMALVPDLNLGVFISANTDTGGGLTYQAPAAIVGEFYAGPRAFPRPGTPELAQAARTFSGYYISTRRAYSGLEGLVTSVHNAVTISVTADGRLIDSDGGAWVLDGPVDEGRFVAANGDAAHMAFTIRDGRAVSFIGAGGSAVYERAPLWRQPTTLALLAALTAAAALATLAGVPLRNRREFRENQIQSRAGLVQNIQAALWIASVALFALWLSKTGDLAEVMYRWPGVLMITASACALVAAALTIVTVIALPAIWRGGRRVDSWTQLRKAFFTVTVLIYAAFSVVLGLSGGLSPWSG
jgi:CubicO group peptidase (beta-lactamase class C family)